MAGSARAADRPETAWTVAVRWLPWRPRWWRRDWRSWRTDALVPGYVLLSETPPSAVRLGLSIGLGIVVALVGLVSAVFTWVAIGIGAAASGAGHVVLHRPFLVEATSTRGEWSGWWVRGWRNAHRVRRRVVGLVATNVPVTGAEIEGATRHSDPT